MASQRARGAVFTPAPIVEALVDRALEGRGQPRHAADPAAGDGRFLAALAGRAAALYGADIDAGSVAAARRVVPDAHLVVADTLRCGAAAWPDAPPGGFDLVIGNPPFRNQLESETVLGADERASLRERYGDVAAGYADTAALFLVAACEMAASGGRVAMIMPLAFLAARDAAPARRRVLELAGLAGIWLAPDGVFPDASVRVCALVLDRSGPRRRSIGRWVGEHFEEAASIQVDSDRLRGEPTWGPLVADLLGVPRFELAVSGRIGEIGAATAGFRRQFYGLAPHVNELGEARGPAAPLVTVGLVDAGSTTWGRRRTRVAGRWYTAPVVELDSLAADDPALARWVAARLGPKLVIATQTKVVEAAPDPYGEWVPSTPLVALHPRRDPAGRDLWRMLAALLSPPVTAHALSRYAGAALATGALKLSARQVEELPLPADRALLDEAARRLERAYTPDAGVPIEVVREVAPLTTEAYRCEPGLTEWWSARLG